jgi:hypothetical protein
MNIKTLSASPILLPLSCNISQEQVIGKLARENFNKKEKVILIISAARSCGTALLNTFSHSGYNCVYQLMKSTLRRLWKGLPIETIHLKVTAEPCEGGLHYNFVSQEAISMQEECEVSSCIRIFKESLGPYFIEECKLNPISILMKLGYRKQNITVIFCLREPLQVAVSWRKYFWDRQGLPNPCRSGFELVFEQIRNLREFCDLEKVRYVNFFVENSQENLARVALTQLFRSLDLPVKSDLHMWKSTNGFGTEYSNVLRVKEPDEFRVPGILDSVKYGTQYKYFPKIVDRQDIKWLGETENLVALSVYESFYN